MSRQSTNARSNEVVLASAGTGKTYRLTSRFLALLAGGAPAESILATTFTRKAAGEIFDRVVRRLLAACESGGRADQALAELRESVDAPITADDCRRILAGIAERLHRLHVRTIDSFFVQAALTYAMELDLMPGWRIVEDDEDELIRLEAIDRVLEGGDRSELVALIRVMRGGVLARSVHRAMMRAVECAYSVYLQTIESPRAWEAAAPSEKPLADAELAGAIERLERLDLPTTGKGTVHAGWATAHAKALGLARGGAWESFLTDSMASRIAAGDEKYYGKEVSPDCAKAFGPLIRHAGVMALAEIDAKNRATRRFLADFDREYWALKRARAAYRFDDIPRLLLERAADEGLGDLYYRLDGRVTHLLLDEFQDTSITQFELLRPMLEEMLADPSLGRSVFCVGDVKQSLYGWRDAEPELLVRLPERWPQLGPASTLEVSYRSSPVVLDAVNRVFSDIASNEAVNPVEAGEVWKRRFNAHRPADKLAKAPGEAALLVGPGDEGDAEDKRRAMLEYAATRVRAIRDRAPGATIGVLVRKRNRIPTLIHALGRLGIEASEEGGNPVVDDPGVGAAVSLLWLADHPGDSAARYHVATSPIGPAVGLTDPRDRGSAERVASQLRRRLSREGYAPTLATILNDCAASLDERGFNRFCQLIDLAQQFDESPATRPADFVRIVQKRGVEEPGRRQVRVMTAHAAKGLEFDAVVLPDLEDGWVLGAGDMLMERDDPLAPALGVSLYVKGEIRALSPRLQRMHHQRLTREAVEELCVLYVSMTRARHAIEMIVQPQKDARARATLAGVLHAALAPGAELTPFTTLWSSASDPGAPDWPAHVAAHVRDEAPAQREPIELVVRRPEGARASRLQRRAPSSLEGGTRLDVADLLRIPDAAALERGTLMHAWLEAIEWLEDGRPGEAELLAVAARCEIDETAARRLLPDFERALAGTELRRILTRGAYAKREPVDSIEVRREAGFAIRDPDPESGEAWLLSGLFDRLVVGLRAHAPVWAEVIDFKTDDVRADDMLEIAGRIDFYRAQIESYRRAACALTRLDRAHVTARLVFTTCDYVVDIGG